MKIKEREREMPYTQQKKAGVATQIRIEGKKYYKR